jgi:ribose 5-phosphate isomerase A
MVVAFEADVAKVHAARSAADLVQPGMIVGLGSGSTATLMVKRLGERVAEEGLDFVGVPTSVTTAELARDLNIPLRDVDDVASVDLNIDGADEIDPQYRMIKGRGGALLREKLVACVAKRRVTIVSPEKIVPRLGAESPVPVEVSRLGYRHVEQRLRKLGAETSLRRTREGMLFVTDGGNLIIDCRFSTLADPETLEAGLKSVVGVFESGLFLGLCDVLVIGRPDGAEQIVTHARRWTGCA